MRCNKMNDNMREIHCNDMAGIEREFPEEMLVVREMLAEIGWWCPDESTAF